MPDPATAQKTTPLKAPQKNQSILIVRIHGKLISADRFDGKNGLIFTNTIVIPAADEYSSPTRLSVKSGHQLAQIDAMVNVNAMIRSRYWKNGEGKITYNPELWLED